MSANGETAGGTKSGLPASRYRNAAIWSRFTGSADRNVRFPSGSAQPCVIPSVASQLISRANADPSVMSRKAVGSNVWFHQ